MKKLIYLFLLMVVLTLTACSTNNQESIDIDLTDSELEQVELAKADLSLDEFNDGMEEFNQETAKLNDSKVENHFKGATYEAYLLTRAKLSKENFEKAQAQEYFAKELNYESYKNVSDPLINRDEFESMVKDDETANYGAYAAKTVQYLTPEGSPN